MIRSLALMVFGALILALLLFKIGLKGEPDIRLVLQDPLEFDKPVNRCDSELCSTLVDLLDRSQKSIDFAIYGARLQADILGAILRARDRGVKVRGYVDKDANGENYYISTEHWELQIGTVRDDQAPVPASSNHKASGVQCSLRSWPRQIPCGWPRFSRRSCRHARQQPQGFSGPVQCLAYDLGQGKYLVAGHASREEILATNAIMHDKFFVVDGKYVWTGSANISNSGTGGYNANAVVIVRSKDVASVYSAEFDKLWTRGEDCDKENDGIEEFALASGKVTTWFSPQDATLRYGVASLITRAQHEINIAVFFLTDKYVTANLIEAHRRGVKVRVIIDATAAKNGYSKHEVLRVAGLPVRIENWGGKMHMKAASIDDRYLVLGSMNWTSSGHYTNDENSLLVDSPGLVGQFDQYFERIWRMIPQEWQKRGARPDPESWESGTSCEDGVDNDFDALADHRDPGCSTTPPPLPGLPPHSIISKQEYQSIRGDYRLISPNSCHPSYPDWFVCLPPWPTVKCEDLPYRGFTVRGKDPLRLDSNGDGIGCNE